MRFNKKTLICVLFILALSSCSGNKNNKDLSPSNGVFEETTVELSNIDDTPSFETEYTEEVVVESITEKENIETYFSSSEKFFKSCIKDNQNKNISIEYIKKKINEDNYPEVDGSTACMPLMAMLRSEVLGEDLVMAQNNTLVSTTDYAWRNLQANNICDLIIAYEPSSETKDILYNSCSIKISPIGVDALVFITNKDNKISNLTMDEVQKIYTGEIKNWKELGGDDKPIQAFQRPLNSGSQTLFLNLVMKDLVPKKAAQYERPGEMDGLINELASYNDSANAIGYSVYYYAKKMYLNPDLKFISIDGIMPSDETISNGTYPFLNKFYVATQDNELEYDDDAPSQLLYNYLSSDSGKELLKKAGYVPNFDTSTNNLSE